MTDRNPEAFTIDQARSLRTGDKVVLLVDTTGCDPDDVERTYPAGTIGTVSGLSTLPAPQNLAVTISVGNDEDRAIVAVFDESDDEGYAFRRENQEECALRGEPRMQSAGSELMALTFRLEKHPEFADDVARLREIAGWASVDRPSDFEHGSMRVLGSMVGAMRRRNYVFSEDRPILTQFEELLDLIPDPLPGDRNFVHQESLEPTRRRDVFDANVDLSEVRRWTAGDGVPRALCHAAIVRPAGTSGTSLVQAEGFLADLLKSDSTVVLKLRSIGEALVVVGRGDMTPKIQKAPLAVDSRKAAVVLHTLPYDRETAGLVAKGIDEILEEGTLQDLYAPETRQAAIEIRDALKKVAK